MTGKVEHLFIKTTRGATMKPVSRVRVVSAKGLEGDISFGRRSRQLLILECEVLDEFDLNPGDLRENITLSGIKISNLESGSHLKIGDVRIEIIGECTPCGKLNALRDNLQNSIEGQRGMFGNALNNGVISIGDTAIVLDEF
ncbi:MAG: MOSC domain-containing protein [Anaerolineales bacterium]|nr:MOSC domain-containing protein [Anaerolineales bacterium]